jgi:heavy metal-binding protein
MRVRAFALLLVTAGLFAVLQAQQATPSVSASAGPLSPISWTCPMHPDVVEDKKGVCPRPEATATGICNMTLVPVRLMTIWSCPVHAVIEESKAGKCRICGRDLVQKTVALTWTCAGHPEIDQIEPGRCADGKPMLAHYTARPHGDHNPRHGGLFFMAPDNWHHIEGAYPGAGHFRAYLYDDYTKPLPLAEARKVRGRIVLKEIFDPATRTSRELSAVPLVLAKNGAYLEARLDPLALAALPVTMAAKMTFGPDDRESRFDFTFPAYSKDVIAPAAPPANSSAAASPKPAAQQPDPAIRTTLLNDLKARDEEVGSLVKSGGFGAIWLPALQAKDIALELQRQQGAATGSQAPAVEEQVKRLVVAAYELDRDGDLGDAQKITEAYGRFSAAISALSSLLSAQP